MLEARNLSSAGVGDLGILCKNGEEKPDCARASAASCATSAKSLQFKGTNRLTETMATKGNCKTRARAVPRHTVDAGRGHPQKKVGKSSERFWVRVKKAEDPRGASLGLAGRRVAAPRQGGPHVRAHEVVTVGWAQPP